LFLSRPRTDFEFYLHELPRLADELRVFLRQSLRRMVYPYLHRPPELPLGHGMIFHRPFQRPETQIRKLIESTRRTGRYEADRALRERAAVLERIVLEEDISTVYEPVVAFEDHRIIGYEALSRGPQGTPLEDPLSLFTVAASCDLEFELDSLCRRRALANASGIGPDQQLFLNILPSCIHDPDFEGVRVRQTLRELGLSPENLVLEISEREAITNFPIFREALDQFSSLGFGIALDDTGAGFASLEAALELCPDYLKIDMSLVRGIEASPERQELLRGLQAVAERMNARLIAEGIETQQELDVVVSLGISCGQGFYLGRGTASVPGGTGRAAVGRIGLETANRSDED
jgi:EAL domain-containing protein (putative c-di-GMP-specific phosphodiesterase class I)